MIVVVASRYDQTARALVQRWAGYGAGLLTADDLSVAGWRHYLNAPGESIAIVDGLPVKTTEVSGVLTLLPCIFQDELTRIMPGDREYVAAEMTSFLLASLSALQCPVLNQPTPTCLMGPNWRQEQWVHAAAQIGMRVAPSRRCVRGECVQQSGRSTASQRLGMQATHVVTVVGDRCFGTASESLADQARHLASAAGVDLLTVSFRGEEPDFTFVSASLCSDLTDKQVADAILEYFKSR